MASIRFVFIAFLGLLSTAQSYQQYAAPPPQLYLLNGTYIPSLIDTTTEDLALGLESGLFTSVDLVNAYVARINEVNNVLNAVTEINPDAIAIAQQLDAERANGTVRGPLHGIPILIKNNIGTADKMNTTAGSYALLGAKLPRDSTVAKKLRAAGAVILGKSNLSQWANFRSNNSTNGWSAHGGQVYGAYYPQQDPSGSSSGSGVAASLGLALAALGTETDGSIISPSEYNSLVGIKTTVGLTSRSLVIPISEHQDTVGPMARSVKDAAYLLQAIAGTDPYDNYTSAIPDNGTLPDYVGACNFSALRGARIGVPTNVLDAFGSSGDYSAQLDAFSSALGVLSAAGATVVTDANFTALQQWIASSNESLVLGADFLVNLKSYFASLTANPNNVTDLASLREFTQTDPREDYPDRDTGVWDAALDAEGYENNTMPAFWDAYQADLYLGGEGGVLGALDRDNLDAVVLPSAFAPSNPALTGAPLVTVPLGYWPANASVVRGDRGLVEAGPNVPFGISFLGRHFDEATLIGFAYAFEQRTLVRSKKRPYIVPNTEIADIVGL